MDATPRAPYVAFIGAIGVGILPHERTFPGLADRKDFLGKEVMKGQDRDEYTSTFEGFGSSLFLASWNASSGRHVYSQTDTCIEIELGKVSSWYSCLKGFEGFSKQLLENVTICRDDVLIC